MYAQDELTELCIRSIEKNKASAQAPDLLRYVNQDVGLPYAGAATRHSADK